MIVLGIESTAHTFGIGIAKSDGTMLANVIKQHTTKKGGLLPYQVADHHVEICDVAINEALEKANLTMKDINAIAFSQGPGIGHCLRIGAVLARMLSLKYKIPLIGVNHCISHLEIAKVLTGAKDPVLLYASGANTQVIAFESGKYRVMGETLDMGTGNFLDTFARDLDIGFPGGPIIENLASKSKNYIELPYTVKGMDLSFGGLLTNLRDKIKTKNYKKEDLCYSIQETVFAMLVEIAERALAHTDKNELVIGGGVACNSRLQEMCKIMCKERGAKFFAPEKQYLVDNGAMIAWLGILELKKGNQTKISKSQILPYWRTDEV